MKDSYIHCMPSAIDRVQQVGLAEGGPLVYNFFWGEEEGVRAFTYAGYLRGPCVHLGRF